MDENIIIVNKVGGIVLDLGNVVFDEERNIIGLIEDVFGNINNAHY